MKVKTLKNTLALVSLGALIVIAGIPLGAISDSGSVSRPAEVQRDTDIEKVLETDIATVSERRGRVYYADEANFAELVLSSDVPILVSFYADWCGPCRMLEPVLEELTRETQGARIVKVNIDDSPELTARYKITSIPSLRVFEDGEVVGEHQGLASKAELKKMLDT